MKKIFLYLICGFLITSSTNAELNLELPSNFTQAQKTQATGVQKRFYSAIGERQTGLKILRKIRQSGQIIEDPEINAWVRSVGNRLVTGSLSSTNPFYFLVSKKTSINAFATEGGVIVINAGLILKSASEAEVAAVLAHEIAHVSQRHIARMKKKAKLDKLGTTAALIAGVAAGSQDSQAGSAIINTTLATMAHRQLSFSREAESEADREGLRILSRAGYDPMAMPNVLGKLESFGESKYAEIQEFLQNHPLTHKRVTDTLDRAKRMGVYKKNRKDDSFLYIREKIRAVTGTVQSAPNTLNLTFKRYGQAQKLMNGKRYQDALKQVNLNSKKLPEVIMNGQLLNKSRQYQRTIDKLLPLYSLYPSNKALLVPLAEAYLALGQSKSAWTAMKSTTLSEQTSLEYFELFQKVASSIGDRGFAYYLSAQRNLRTANYKVAKLQTKQAIKLSTDPKLQEKLKNDLLAINKLMRR